MPIIQEIKEEHDLDQPTNPGLDVRVPRHVDLSQVADCPSPARQLVDLTGTSLLVDPVQRIEHSVAPKHHHVEASAPAASSARFDHGYPVLHCCSAAEMQRKSHIDMKPSPRQIFVDPLPVAEDVLRHLGDSVWLHVH